MEINWFTDFKWMTGTYYAFRPVMQTSDSYLYKYTPNVGVCYNMGRVDNERKQVSPSTIQNYQSGMTRSPGTIYNPHRASSHSNTVNTSVGYSRYRTPGSKTTDEYTYKPISVKDRIAVFERSDSDNKALDASSKFNKFIVDSVMERTDIVLKSSRRQIELDNIVLKSNRRQIELDDDDLMLTSTIRTLHRSVSTDASTGDMVNKPGRKYRSSISYTRPRSQTATGLKSEVPNFMRSSSCNRNIIPTRRYSSFSVYESNNLGYNNPSHRIKTSGLNDGSNLEIGHSPNASVIGRSSLSSRREVARRDSDLGSIASSAGGYYRLNGDPDEDSESCDLDSHSELSFHEDASYTSEDRNTNTYTEQESTDNTQQALNELNKGYIRENGTLQEICGFDSQSSQPGQVHHNLNDRDGIVPKTETFQHATGLDGRQPFVAGHWDHVTKDTRAQVMDITLLFERASHRHSARQSWAGSRPLANLSYNVSNRSPSRLVPVGSPDAQDYSPTARYAESPRSSVDSMSRLRRSVDLTPKRTFSRESRPLFLIKPRRQFADEGGEAKFKASFDGEPTPIITWQKNEKTIRDGEKYKLYEKNDFHFLEVCDVSKSDKASYTCIVSNKLGTITATAQLEVFAKPKLLLLDSAPRVERALVNTEVLNGDPFTLECQISGSPAPKITWSFNDQLLKSSLDIKQTYLSHCAKLIFREIFPDDCGKYECTASNSKGEVKTSCWLSVKEYNPDKTVPVFTQPLKDSEVSDGDEVQLECHVASSSPITEIIWHKNTVTIEGARDLKTAFDGKVARLYIVDVFLNDAGNYTCIAKNSFGSAQTSAKLSVSDISMNKASNGHRPEIGIFSSGKRGSMDTVSSITSRGESITSSLDSQDVSTRNESHYFLQPLQDISSEKGSRVELLAKATGKPPLVFCWFHGEQEIKKDNKDYQITVDGSTAHLVIPHVRQEHAGKWTCEVYDDDGDDECTCQLTLTDPVKDLSNLEGPRRKQSLPKAPVFTRSPTSVSIEEGTCAKLTCQVSGSPQPAIKWTKDGKELKQGGRFRVSCKQGVHSFEIPHSLATDGGLYMVTATNSEGVERCNVMLTVDKITNQETISDYRSLLKSRPSLRDLGSSSPTNSSTSESEREVDGRFDYRSVLKKGTRTKKKPEMIKRLQDIKAVEGEPVKLTCKVIGCPQPSILWLAGKKEIKESKYFKMSFTNEVATLEIAEVYPEDEGRYKCVAENILGSTETSCRLSVLENNSQTSAGDQLNSLSNNCHSLEIDEATGLPKLKLEPPTDNTSEGQVTEEELDPVFIERDNSTGGQFTQAELDPVFIEKDLGITCEKVLADAVEKGLSSGISQLEINQTIERRLSLGVPQEEIAAALKRHVSIAVGAEEPPFIEDLSPENIHVRQGQSFELCSEFVGDPLPQVEWHKGKTQLISDDHLIIKTTNTTSTLTVNNAQMSDTGCYVLMLTSELGTDKVGSSVTVEDIPDPPSGHCGISSITRNSLVLSWYGPSFDGGTSVTSYKVEIAKTSDMVWKTLTTDCKNTTYQVSKLLTNVEYVFRVSARNVHGFGEPGNVSEPVVCINRKLSRIEVPDSGASVVDHTDLSPLMLSSPLSPAALRAARDELAFSPRRVEVQPGRDYKELYKVGNEIGKGRFGSVCICTEKASGREFAAKFIKVKPSQRSELKHEISVMNELHHPKLLLLWDAFESSRQMVLIMEHVAGGELFERIIDDDYILTERECVHFMRQLCDGVHYMHSKSILHLDLKPENILCITKNSNEIKIIDFGLARKFDPNKSFKVMFGTPEFVAPEVVNYDNIHYTTDMWSIGVICYILISGLSPFLGDNDSETFSNVTSALWDFEDDTFDDVSDDAKDFISKLLVKPQKKRNIAEECLKHTWLSQDVKFMRAKRLSTEKHKKYMARRKWQKTANAIRALGRMASLQKMMIGNSASFSSATRSRTSSVSSFNSDAGSTASTKSAPPTPSGKTIELKSRVSESDIEASKSTPILLTRQSSPDMRPDKSGKHERQEKTHDVIHENGKSGDPEEELVVDDNANMGDHPKQHFSSSLTLDLSENRNISLPEVTLNIGLNPLKNHSHSTANGIISNTGNSSHKQDIDISQKSVPTFVKEMKNFDVFQGDSARFDVQVTAHPEPTVTWFKNGQKLCESGKYMMESDDTGRHSLVIKDCEPNDCQEYGCKVTNSEGSASCKAELYVEADEDGV